MKEFLTIVDDRHTYSIRIKGESFDDAMSKLNGRNDGHRYIAVDNLEIKAGTPTNDITNLAFEMTNDAREKAKEVIG